MSEHQILSHPEALPRLSAKWTGVVNAASSSSSSSSAEATQGSQVAWIDEDNGEVRELSTYEGAEPNAALALSLWQAIESPLNGKPGLPSELIVESEAAAVYLRTRLTEQQLSLKVSVSPDTLAGQALNTSSTRIAHSVGYLSRSDASLPVLKDFFTQACRWAQEEPWMAVAEGELLTVTGLGDEPLVLVVMGAGSPDQGLAVFSSLQDVAGFADNPYSVRLFFQYCDEYVAGPGVQLELLEHELPVASGEMIPVAGCPRDQEPFAGPADLRLLISAMQVVSAYVQSDLPGRKVVSSAPLVVNDELLVKITVQHIDQPLVEEAQRPKVGRNEPCWCGSGKKYKKCCYQADQIKLSEQLRAAQDEADE